MNWKAFLVATLAAGVVCNALDAVVQGGWFTANYYSKLPQLFKQNGDISMYVLGDFIAVAMLAWFYHVVRGSFGTGLMNGLRYGVYTGLLIAFPMYIFLHLMLVAWPYALSWAMTIYSIIWTAIAGAVIGLVHEKLG